MYVGSSTEDEGNMIRIIIQPCVKIGGRLVFGRALGGGFNGHTF